MVDRKGNPSPAKLSVRITQDSTSAIAGDALEQTNTSTQKLSHPIVSDLSGAFTNISDNLPNQQNLVLTLFNGLMKKFEPLVKIADEVAKVRSSVSIGRSELIIFSKDPSLCQFRVAGAFCRNEGELTRLFWSFSSYASIRSDGASTTSSGCEDSRPRQSHGEYLLVRSFRRRTEEPPCSSRHHGRNTEAND